MSMMVPSIFSASINRAAVLNNRDGRAPNRFERLYRGVQNRLGRLRQPRGRSSLFSHQIPSTDSLYTTPSESERVDHHSENGARSPRGLGRLFNFRRRHMELMEHRDVVFSSFDQSFLTSRLASGTPRLFHRTLRFFTSENQWVSVEGRVATPCASENGGDGEVSEYEPQEESGQSQRSDGWNLLESSSSSVFETYFLLHCLPSITLRRRVSLRMYSCTIVSVLGRAVHHTPPEIWVSHQEEVPEDVIRVRTGQIRHGKVLANREFGAPALEDGSPPLYLDDDESPPEYDVAAFLGSPLYRLHNGMLLDIHHAALQADDFIRYYGDCWNRCPQRL
ncbi:hypothetical protein E4U47_007146 [Claviceps purpurea]|nr:hypothetical protein E4U47_007146 [Claviceps purpurea]